MSNDRLVIEYKGKKYVFSTQLLIIYPIGTLILAILIVFFFELPINFWLPGLVAKQSTFLLNCFFDLGAEVVYYIDQTIPWYIRIPDSVSITISSDCTGILAMSIFTSIIIFTPHSQDFKTSEDIIRRKAIDVILTIIFIYLINIIRIIVIIYFYHLGAAWSEIHDSLANLSAVIAAHIFIFLFCNKLIPEWYISIYYSGKLILNHFKTK